MKWKNKQFPRARSQTAKKLYIYRNKFEIDIHQKTLVYLCIGIGNEREQGTITIKVPRILNSYVPKYVPNCSQKEYLKGIYNDQNILYLR